MFSSRSKGKNQSKRPTPAQATSSSAQKQTEKQAERSRAAKSPGGHEPAQDAQEPRASKDSSSLNPHLTFEGNLKFSGTVLVDCDFSGTVVTEDTLVVGINGALRAEVTAGIVEVSGKVYGNIRASKRVKIYSGGEVHGNIETPTISMEEGVIFEGACTRPGAATRPAQQPQSQKAEDSERPAPMEPRTVTTETSALETARKKLIASTPELVEAR